MSALRARCPDCRTLTAVAVDGGYECHSCGREFNAGLVRVPRAWGRDGEAIAAAAMLPLPYPETAVIDRPSLDEQSSALAAALPERPVVVGGCCCAHVGSVQGLAERGPRLAVVWLDAHGDLNTPETSLSGNLWGMPLRMLLDGGVVRAEDVALVGARNLDPPELEYLAKMGIDDSLDRALAETDAVYVAFDFDVLDPKEAESFMPESDGLTVAEAEALVREIAARSGVAGVGMTAFRPSEKNAALIGRFLAAAGF